MNTHLKLLTCSSLIALTLLGLSKAQDGDSLKDPNKEIEKTKTWIVSTNGEKFSTKLNHKLHLSDLRVELTNIGKITTNDLFLDDGTPIDQKYESDFVISEIMKDNTISFKARESSSVSSIFSDITNPKKKPEAKNYGRDATLLDSPEKFNFPTSKADSYKTEIDNRTSKTSSQGSQTLNNFDYTKLSEEEHRKIIGELNLEKAFKINAGIVEKSSEKTIQWNIQPKWSRPFDDHYKDGSYYSYSKIDHEFKKSGITNAGLNVAYLGMGVDVEYENNKKKLEFKQATNIYFLATHNYPIVEFSIPSTDIKASEAFEKAIEKIVVKNDDDIGSKIELDNILNKFGRIVPTKFVIGGQIRSEEEKTIESETEAEEARQKFGGELSFTLASGLSTTAGGGHSSTTTTTTSTNEMRHKINLEVKGGDPAKRNIIEEWEQSLSEPKTWKVIRIDGFTSVIDILRDDLREKCEKLLIKKQPIVDLSAYTINNAPMKKLLKKSTDLRLLEVVNLSGCSINDGDCAILAKLPNLTQLNLSHNNIKGAAVLSQIPTLRDLDISWNQVDTNAAIDLSRISSLTALNLGYNKIDKPSNVIRSLIQNTRIKKLGFSKPYVLSNVTNVLCDHAEAATGLGVGLGVVMGVTFGIPTVIAGGSVAAGSALFEATVGTGLTAWVVGAASSSAALGGIKLTQIQIHNILPRMLGEIKLDDNDLKELAKSKSLTELNLSDNAITDEGIQALLAGIPTLISLNLDYNLIGDKGVKGLSGNTTLTTLSLGRPQAKWLERTVDVWANRITDTGAKDLARNTTLTYLNLIGNNIGNEGTMALRTSPNM